ncbi:MAG: DegV family protein [Candidatus Pelethousia sp.]|nr:DegV family protein [Candidatus Pelethousia sp.]
MAIRFVICSTADFPYAEAQEKGIVLLPLHITFGAASYRDVIDISHREFYEKLIESDELPKTSQVPPGDFAKAFQEIVSAGDTAIVITISEKLSGTVQSARIAAEDFPGHIFIVDSDSACIGEQVLIRYGLMLAEQGMEAEEIVQKLETAKHEIRLIALLDTLEYLKKGGRISAAKAFAGGILSIKPVIAVSQGEITVIGKARGSKQGNNLLREMVEKSGGVDFSRPFLLAYTGLDDTVLQKYIADSRELWEKKTDKLPICTIGSTIGTHAGPGAVALAYFAPQG